MASWEVLHSTDVDPIYTFDDDFCPATGSIVVPDGAFPAAMDDYALSNTIHEVVNVQSSDNGPTDQIRSSPKYVILDRVKYIIVASLVAVLSALATWLFVVNSRLEKVNICAPKGLLKPADS
ncbi:hypothetical protein GALMADRAFT_587845 [Galerina marginata CBS 339.88]|uniref:Uncharacterized protein n=1 Tax=Galerina marginata (strain CBS 339.88) TaxID=685588 RepID=A0A067SUE9_GALM3|nr:hypothetical protein GALMADRAFT_587845 [Galerina marginata CBS 339.88]